MKKKVLNIIIAFTCISLTGIVTVQYFWIRNAIKVKESQFDRSVNDAMSAVVNKLETREDIVYMKNNLVGDSIHALVQSFSEDPILSLNTKLDSLLKIDEKAPPPRRRGMPLPGSFYNNYSDGVLVDMDSIFRHSQHFDIITQEYPDGFSFELRGEFDSRQMDSILLLNERRMEAMQKQIMQELPGYAKPGRGNNPRPRQYNIHPGYPKSDGNSTRIIVDKDCPDPAQVHEDMRIITKKARKIKDVIQKMAREMEAKPIPIEKRIDKENLVKSLSKAFSDKDIHIPFEYAVIANSQGKSKVPLRSDGFRIDKKNQIHRVSLFPNDIFRKPDVLLLYFPGQKNVILRSLSWLMLGSVFFTLIVIISSVTGIITMLRQKKISDIKTDFINNMTHEFKTPIATISVAIDSINNPKVIDEPDRIRSYTQIIKQENNRMNARVEQVLQMALLDSREFRLDLKPVRLNPLIEKVAGNIHLQVENREGHLVVQTSAQNDVVEADETHLANVFLNLLDNANKYSAGKPEINVTTNNRGSSIVITVADKGIGMSTETQRKIFDKFYRVTSGNIHNVKGFGLGLSYARAIVLAHKGGIQVISEPGKGSRFEIVLPLITSRTEVGGMRSEV